MIIKNGNVFTAEHKFETKDIHIKGQLFDDYPQDDEDMIVDAADLYVIPGLVDIHFHGCVGHDFCDGTSEAIDAIAQYEASQGVTSICPATMTLDEAVLEKIFSNAGSYKNEKGALLCGINMEGPFINKAKKGAQNGKFIHKPDPAFFRKMQKASGGLIRQAAIAPETDGALSFIEALKDEVVLSIAHTAADYDIAAEAFAKGVSHVTHLYNAMPPYTHREPGVIGAAADASDVHVELICDGIHIHPAAVRTTFRMFGDDRICMISDSMMATGMAEGEYRLGGQAVYVKGKRAELADGTIAGSASNLMDCFRKAAIDMNIPLESVIKCCTINPARAMGIDDKHGSIESGKYANAVLLDKDLNIKHIICRGSVIS